MRRFFFATAFWLILIRVWLLTIRPNYLEKSSLVSEIENSGYHHWQIGIVLFVVFFVLWLLLRKLSFLFKIGLAFSVALIVDQYTMVIEMLGIPLGIIYLSIVDTVVVVFIALGLVYLGHGFKGKKKTKEKESEIDEND